MASPEEQLEAIVNPGQTVLFMGKNIRVKRLTLGPLTRITPYLGPLAYVFEDIFSRPRDDKGKPILTDAEALHISLVAISGSGESVMGVISEITGKTKEELEEADIMESSALLAATMEENLRFFSENAAKFKDVWGRLKQVGTKFSKSSSNGATAPKTESSTSTPLTTLNTSLTQETVEVNENEQSSSIQ